MRVVKCERASSSAVGGVEKIMASGLPSLEALLGAIPEENRYRLDHKLENRKSRATIAKSITNWRVVAPFIPNIENDIDGIEHDNHSLEEQK